MLKHPKTRQQMESDRLGAAKDFANGMRPSDVARKYGVSRMSASRWYRRLAESGVAGMHLRRATGRPPRGLSRAVWKQIAAYRADKHTYKEVDHLYRNLKWRKERPCQ